MAKANKYVNFVSDEHFLACVRHVCEAYPASKKEIELEVLYRNTLDPFKMVFDIINTKSTVDAWIKGETIRQGDKTLNNRIGDFHQRLLGGANGWTNLGTGDESKVDLKKSNNSIFIELKNKFNTVNADSLAQVKSDARIRKISGKKVYELVTGDPYALEAVWKALPKAMADLGVEFKVSNPEKARLVEFFKMSLQ